MIFYSITRPSSVIKIRRLAAECIMNTHQTLFQYLIQCTECKIPTIIVDNDFLSDWHMGSFWTLGRASFGICTLKIFSYFSLKLFLGEFSNPNRCLYIFDYISLGFCLSAAQVSASSSAMDLRYPELEKRPSVVEIWLELGFTWSHGIMMQQLGWSSSGLVWLIPSCEPPYMLPQVQ